MYEFGFSIFSVSFPVLAEASLQPPCHRPFQLPPFHSSLHPVPWLTLGSPESELETQTQTQVVYLGFPSGSRWGSRVSETGKRKMNRGCVIALLNVVGSRPLGVFWNTREAPLNCPLKEGSGTTCPLAPIPFWLRFALRNANFPHTWELAALIVSWGIVPRLWRKLWGRKAERHWYTLKCDCPTAALKSGGREMCCRHQEHLLQSLCTLVYRW